MVQKNAQLEKVKTSGKLKTFKTDMLGCSADELNYSLCLFVKEVRKPNGEEYAPDSIYYLCLGKLTPFSSPLQTTWLNPMDGRVHSALKGLNWLIII